MHYLEQIVQNKEEERPAGSLWPARGGYALAIPLVLASAFLLRFLVLALLAGVLARPVGRVALILLRPVGLIAALLLALVRRVAALLLRVLSGILVLLVLLVLLPLLVTLILVHIPLLRCGGNPAVSSTMRPPA
jgi:hypothetical protein